MKLSLASHVRLSPAVLHHRLDKDLMMLDTNAGVYYGLDPVGRRMWELLGEQAELALVHAQLLREFEVTPQLLEADLLRLTEELLAKGLLEPAADGGNLPPSQ